MNIREELREYLEITIDTFCNRCENCSEDKNCRLSKMLDGFTNIEGVDLIKIIFREDEE